MLSRRTRRSYAFLGVLIVACLAVIFAASEPLELYLLGGVALAGFVASRLIEFS